MQGPMQCAGATLVELVVSIVVISIGLAGVLLVMNRNVSSSGDPMVQHQAIAIAEAYLEEILAKEFTDPDGGETGGPEAGETRGTFDDVNDYNGLVDTGARDQNNNPIAGLGGYNVGVAVVSQAWNGIPAADALLATVTVTGPGGVSITLSGYRTRY
jgi:MSHA pilin protein MshD